MRIEPRAGSRPEDSVSSRLICEMLLAPKSVSIEKAGIEGKWVVHRAILGFLINTTEGAIRAPQECVLVSMNMVSPETFAPWNARITLRDVQLLGGLRPHWWVASWFWEISHQTLGARLAHAGEASSYATCIDADIWTSFWNLSEVMRRRRLMGIGGGGGLMGGWGAA